MDTMPPVYGMAEVSNNQAVVLLYNSSTMVPWTGNGSWYAGLQLKDGRGWISRAAIDFTANPNPSKAFSDFKPYVYSYKLGEIVKEAVFDTTPSITLNTFFTGFMGVSYTDFLTEEGADYTLYKNEAMTHRVQRQRYGKRQHCGLLFVSILHQG
jgi:hypothetical protein